MNRTERSSRSVWPSLCALALVVAGLIDITAVVWERIVVVDSGSSMPLFWPLWAAAVLVVASDRVHLGVRFAVSGAVGLSAFIIVGLAVMSRDLLSAQPTLLLKTLVFFLMSCALALWVAWEASRHLAKSRQAAEFGEERAALRPGTVTSPNGYQPHPPNPSAAASPMVKPRSVPPPDQPGPRPIPAAPSRNPAPPGLRRGPGAVPMATPTRHPPNVQRGAVPTAGHLPKPEHRPKAPAPSPPISPVVEEDEAELRRMVFSIVKVHVDHTWRQAGSPWPKAVEDDPDGTVLRRPRIRAKR